ncbi:hypothetical protein [Spiroplasma alleghenense]|uniref:Uncharacterized protein n=1 Tax=Spiroplasma alleghenense TaxID=216931 RepID=A0A345Z4Q8_9MOLU|nr:hypothetical protein [Spiroplasma alleghenense]AXK51587.1 hypothetical protein SALLE_v1c09170 [Spiroplasma alleghenense]
MKKYGIENLRNAGIKDWIKNSKLINYTGVENLSINLDLDLLIEKVTAMGEENLKDPKIKEIINILSTE